MNDFDQKSFFLVNVHHFEGCGIGVVNGGGQSRVGWFGECSSF